jgi:hypothetical protein
MQEATQLLGSLMGKPDLKYVQSSLEDSRGGMSAMGLSQSFIDAVLQTATSFNNKDQWGQQESSPLSLTPTTLTAFAEVELGKQISEDRPSILSNIL